MTYLALARKWRPRTFAELVGQEHVVRALRNALDTGRVHHAFLFTGTRGVGKTTIARIFAKSLNCETGVSSEPCGQCAVCREVDAGRFVDLVEIDAASHTGVDDVRELIESAQFAPARGRYKVFLIDEVHMLSRSAFNALLKTLEEPPGHVRFLLATTDPQKLPVTVLSRCLQFNLRRLREEEIAGQMTHILAAEEIAAAPEALALLAHAADGSLRDALSLLDQAIAHGGGAVQADEVRAMLGTLDQDAVLRLLEALAAGDGSALYAAIEAVAAYVVGYDGVLDSMAAALHQVQLRQVLPQAAPDAPEFDPARIAALAAAVAAEDVQVWYQIAINGSRDVALAPTPRIGFEMSLLRMLAFRPDDGDGDVAGGGTPRAAGAAPPPPRSAGAPAPGAVGDRQGVREGAPASTSAASAAAPVPPTPAAAPAGAPAGARATDPMVDGRDGREGALTSSPAARAAAAASPARAAPSSATPAGTTGPAATPTPAGPATAVATAVAPVVNEVPPWATRAPADDEAPPWATAGQGDDLPPDANVSVSAATTAPPKAADAARPTPAAPVDLPPPRIEARTMPTPSPATPVMAAPRPSHATSGPEQPPAPVAAAVPSWPLDADTWLHLAADLELRGVARQLADNCVLTGCAEGVLRLALARSQEFLNTQAARTAVQEAAGAALGRALRIEVSLAGAVADTAALRAEQARSQRQQAAERAFAAHPGVQALLAQTGGEIVAGSVRPP